MTKHLIELGKSDFEKRIWSSMNFSGFQFPLFVVINLSNNLRDSRDFFNVKWFFTIFNFFETLNTHLSMKWKLGLEKQ